MGNLDSNRKRNSANFLGTTQTKSVSSRRQVWLIGGFIATVIFIVTINYVSVTSVARSVLKEDVRNRELGIWAYHPYGVIWTQVIFDVRDVPLTASCADVTRTFLQFAERMKDRSFSQIRLASRGEVRFLLDGDDFRTLGREHGWQNPVYTLRTLPEKLHRPDGSPAYRAWTGGLLGVVAQQMQDLTGFCRAWFANDLL